MAARLHVRMFAFIRSLAPGLPLAHPPHHRGKPGPGLAYGFPRALSAPGSWVSGTPRAAGTRDTRLTGSARRGSAGTAGRAGCLQQPVLPPHPSPDDVGTAGTLTAPCTQAWPRWSGWAGGATSNFGEQALERS